MLIEHGEMVKLQKVQWSNEIYGDNYFSWVIILYKVSLDLIQHVNAYYPKNNGLCQLCHQ